MSHISENSTGWGGYQSSLNISAQSGYSSILWFCAWPIGFSFLSYTLRKPASISLLDKNSSTKSRKFVFRLHKHIEIYKHTETVSHGCFWALTVGSGFSDPHCSAFDSLLRCGPLRLLRLQGLVHHRLPARRSSKGWCSLSFRFTVLLVMIDNAG